MKNKKSIVIFIIIVLVIFVLLILTTKKADETELTDAIKFKESYETLNGDNINVSIKDNNPFVYVSEKKLINVVQNGSGLVFIGSKSDNNARSMASVLQYVNNSYILYFEYDKLSDNNKNIISEKIGEPVTSSCVIGILDGKVVGKKIGIKSDLTKDEENQLKLELDEINASVTGEACDTESSSGC